MKRPPNIILYNPLAWIGAIICLPVMGFLWACNRLDIMLDTLFNYLDKEIFRQGHK